MLAALAIDEMNWCTVVHFFKLRLGSNYILNVITTMQLTVIADGGKKLPQVVMSFHVCILFTSEKSEAGK